MANHLQEFQARQSFPLDPFQRTACEAIEEDRGVLVCAPTGAGKTIVGEFAVSLALSRGTKCFYTTPIKALSNQKFHDLVETHGAENVGLLTGDVSINHDADVVVMTTEVLRNMIYAQSATLDRLSHVVMDEIHFLADRSRGAVWEEAILNLDEGVRVIGLSATVSNSEEFGRWLNAVRGDTEVIVDEHRPIPLRQWMMVGKRVHPLFEEGSGGEVNGRLAAHIERIEGVEDTAWKRASSGGFRSRTPGRGTKPSRSGAPRSRDRYRPIGRPEMLSILDELEMLPAITFIFSRAGCDAALFQCQRSHLVLTSDEEAAEIARIVDAGVEEIPEDDLKVLGFRQWKAALQRGFAAHHAGMLPAFRHIVETLFVKGLVRAVFATETLALGINMPARTVVLEKLVKFDGEGHVDLTPGQYTQLTGRAGRRGIDTIGNAVVQWAPAMDPRQVAGLASTRTYPLNSTFTPGYNMSVNLLQTMGFDAAHRLIDMSFAQFQADGSVVEEVRALEQAEQKHAKARRHIEALVEQLAPGSNTPVDDIIEYVDLRARLSDEEKRAHRHNIEQREQEIIKVLGRAQLGDVLAVPSKKRPKLALVVQPASSQRDPRPWVTFEDGYSARIDATQFAMPPITIGATRVPRPAVAHPRKHARLAVQALAKFGAKRPKSLKTKPRQRPTALQKELKAALKAHPVHHWADRELFAREAHAYVRAAGDVEKLRQRIGQATDSLGKQFDRILDLLEYLDYVEISEGQPVVTAEGENLAKIHSESDLLVAQCLKRGIWNELDPAELAGVVSMCTFENRRETQGSPEAATETMATAMNGTWRLWEELGVDEQRHQLPISKEPDAGFALAMHQWTAGAPLEYCMQAAAQSGAELTPGDFVRQARQVIDLLEQVRKTAYNDELPRTARQAIDAIRRGVVAIGA
ncbi:DEAD/DEAH box helicase [Corynebacterium gerontici]|uniref:Ski2-like helicase n=1 Tax=Corynebacterium gerontici TaxID=2079234 RepID=A0A3G6J0U6_9CORY|nr:RNA helicase [Corynebacterium gerontici]AZA11413.1 ski2-like helicase [Corynebacterium gerontici]